MLCARIFGYPLSLDSASLRSGMALPGLGRTFLGFRLGTFCLGCLFVGRRPRAFSLDRATSSLLSKLSSLLTTTIFTPTARSTGDDGDEQQDHDNADNNCDDRFGAHNNSSPVVAIGGFSIGGF